jgi:hypothetical protein
MFWNCDYIQSRHLLCIQSNVTDLTLRPFFWLCTRSLSFNQTFPLVIQFLCLIGPNSPQDVTALKSRSVHWDDIQIWQHYSQEWSTVPHHWQVVNFPKDHCTQSRQVALGSSDKTMTGMFFVATSFNPNSFSWMHPIKVTDLARHLLL